MLIFRFIGNLDLCGRQVHRPCRTSMGFPAVLPHASSDEVAGKYSVVVHLSTKLYLSKINGLTGKIMCLDTTGLRSNQES